MIEVLNEMHKSMSSFNERFKQLEVRIEKINTYYEEQNMDQPAVEEDIELWYERRQYMQENQSNIEFDDDETNNHFMSEYANPRCPDCGKIERPYFGCGCDE